MPFCILMIFLFNRVITQKIISCYLLFLLLAKLYLYFFANPLYSELIEVFIDLN
ncbi:MAG: hypothetical protein KPI85_03405 [cyanobacterium endosymbiont of Epithemia adnata isolate EadnSB Bon19]